MIIEWMIYQCVTALLLGLAALAAERLVDMRRWPRRGIWAASLSACLFVPALATLKPAPAPALSALAAPAAAVLQRDSARAPAGFQPKVAEKVVPLSVSHVLPESVLPVRPGPTMQTLERPAEWIWMGLSLCVLSLYAFATWSLLRRARRWPRQNVEGCVVRVSPSTGPAVLGYIRPEIVLPKWLLSASASELRLVLAHEREHVRARDSLLWIFALLAFALVPWSIPTAWQVRRLRFAIEVDCDARVLRSGVGLNEYGHTLLAVSQRQVLAPLAALSMAARRSLLERRLSILAATRPVNAWFVGAFATLCACCLATAAALPVPRDTSDSIIELPPSTNSPFFLAAAESAARSAYPADFRGELTGTVSISVDLGIDGHVFRIERRQLPSGPLSDTALPFDEEVEGHDAYPIIGSRGREFLGWFGPQHDDGLYLWYRVLKWAPDPTRTSARVRAAVAASYPQFFRASSARDAAAPFSVVTVFMNEDGTINRSSLTQLSTTYPNGEDRLGYQRLLDLGLSAAQFAHRGLTGNWQDGTSRLKYAGAPPLIIHYAWPRRSDDPPDEKIQFPAARQKFRPAERRILDARLPDQGLMKRFFPGVFEHGPDWPNETLWIILDRAGKFWAAGKGEEASTTMMGIEALYPGITLDSGRATGVPTSAGTPINFSMWWLGADSLAPDPKAVNVPGRADLIATLQLVRNDQIIAGPDVAVKVGASAERDMPGGQVEITASAAEPGYTNLSVRITSTDISVLPIVGPWSSPVVHLAYGDKATFVLGAADGQKWRAVLRPMRMAQPIEHLVATAHYPGPAARQPAKSASLAPVLSTPATTRKRDDILALGVVTATTVKVAARVDGQLASVGFVEGRPVEAGQLLASVEAPQLRAQLDRAKDQLSEDRKARAETAISADETAVAEAQRLLAYTQIRAPISGVAGFRKLDPGNFVRAGDTLLVITQVHPIAIVFSVSEDELPRLQARLKSEPAPVVEVWNRAGGTVRLATGRLTAIDNEIDTVTGTVKLKATVDNENGALFPNQFVNVRLLVSAR